MTVSAELAATLRATRHMLIMNTFTISVVAGAVLVAGNMVRNLYFGNPLSYAHPVVYLIALLVYRLRWRIGAERIAWILASIFFLTGTMGLFVYGLAGNSAAVLMTFVVTSTLFFGLRGGLWAMGLSLASLVAAAVAVVGGNWTLTFDTPSFLLNPFSWIAAVITFASMAGLLLNLVWRMNEQQRKMLIDQHRLAFYDALTALPNRRLLADRLHQAFAASTRTGRRGALLFIDLDNFKTLNDTLGHDIGDLLLREVAQRTMACVREGDTVSRLGGDEFIVLIEDMDDDVRQAAVQAQTVGEKILAALRQPYQLDRHRQHITASIGVTLFAGHGSTQEDLMRQADIAMYQAKQAGRNTLRFFDPAMQAAVESRVRLEKWLDQALDLGQFDLHYQPQIRQDGGVVGAEVLLRWMHPERGLVLPEEFVWLAEETGQIIPIGLWALETACRRIKAWENDPGRRNLHLAVNVSARQLRQPDFVEQVVGVLQRTAADPCRLKLEITESLMLDDVAGSIGKMQQLRTLGVTFAMDDFGTGYSSLASLKKLPIDQLKVDRGFVRDVATDDDDAAIVQTIVAMAGALRIEVIAEGVETEEQRELLLRYGCRNFQGYLFGKPLPAEEFERRITPAA